MPSVTDQRMQQIKDIVCEILEIDAEELTMQSLFKEDHDADSLLSIEILARLEKEFGVTIDQAELARMTNLEGVCAIVNASLGSA